METLRTIIVARRTEARRLLGLTVLASLLWGAGDVRSSALAVSEAYSEDEVKAAFLYRIAGYVEWPSALPPEDPFTIAVLKAEGVAAELQRILPGHLVGGHVVRARIIKTIQELDSAQMLYIGPALAENVHHLL